MILIGIDPGSERSGWAFRNRYGKWDFGHANNESIIDIMLCEFYHTGSQEKIIVGIEEMVPRFIGGKKPGWAGRAAFDTARWSGEFRRAVLLNDQQVYLIPRQTVAKTICGNATANHQGTKGALIDRFGGTPQLAVGTKKSPGPLYKIRGTKDHGWSALAVALTAAQMEIQK